MEINGESSAVQLLSLIHHKGCWEVQFSSAWKAAVLT